MIRWDGERLELRCPASWLPFMNLYCFSPTAIRLGDWPEDVYAGRVHAWSGHTLAWTERMELQTKIKIVK